MPVRGVLGGRSWPVPLHDDPPLCEDGDIGAAAVLGTGNSARSTHLRGQSFRDPQLQQLFDITLTDDNSVPADLGDFAEIEYGVVQVIQRLLFR